MVSDQEQVKTLETPSFIDFKTLTIVFFSFLVFYKTNHNNRFNKEVIGNPKSNLVVELANKGFTYTLRMMRPQVP